MFLKSKKISPESYLNGKRIGIAGLGPGCGVTHISIAVANYLSEAEKRKVCLFEQNRHNDIIHLMAALGSDLSQPFFTHHRVTYFPAFTGTLPEYASDLNCDCMVFDFGNDFHSALGNLMLCDIKIVVGTDAYWRQNEYDPFNSFTKDFTSLNSWRLFVNLGNVKRLKEKDGSAITVCCFPFEPDPVYPGKETITFLKEAIFG